MSRQSNRWNLSKEIVQRRKLIHRAYIVALKDNAMKSTVEQFADILSFKSPMTEEMLKMAAEITSKARAKPSP